MSRELAPNLSAEELLLLKLRKKALACILAVNLPEGWSPFPSGESMGTAHQWERTSRKGDAELCLAAIKTHYPDDPQRGIELRVHGMGCSVSCRPEDAQRAIDHVLAWGRV